MIKENIQQIQKEISKRASLNGVTMKILLEVNVANEDSKWGFKVDEINHAFEEINKLPKIEVLGLRLFRLIQIIQKKFAHALKSLEK